MLSEAPHVVWDMGGIIYPFFTERLLEIGSLRGWPIDRIPLGPTGSEFDVDYHRMLEGGMDEPQYVSIVKERLLNEGITFNPHVDLAGGWELRTDAWETIEEIHRRGHRQALLTNDASRWLGDGWWHHWDGAHLFDVMVDVVQVGVRKPAPEPYLAVTASLGVPPDECIFVDDVPANCRGAEQVGMRSHLYEITDRATSLASLLTAIRR